MHPVPVGSTLPGLKDPADKLRVITLLLLMHRLQAVLLCESLHWQITYASRAVRRQRTNGMAAARKIIMEMQPDLPPIWIAQ